MINLLPVKSKKLIEREFLRRFIVAFGLGLSTLLFAQVILSFGAFFLTDSYAETFNKQVIFVEKLAELKNTKDLEAEVNQLNDLLSLFREGEKSTRMVSGDIFNILKFAPSSVKIDSLLFNAQACSDCAPSISVNGYAATRDNLRTFITALTSSGYFGKIESPVSNLLDEKDIDFSLTVELKNGR